MSFFSLGLLPILWVPAQQEVSILGPNLGQVQELLLPGNNLISCLPQTWKLALLLFLSNYFIGAAWLIILITGSWILKYIANDPILLLFIELVHVVFFQI